MSQQWNEAELIEKFDEAFARGPNAPLPPELAKLIAENSRAKELWEEYLQLREGMALLEESQSVSEINRARILQAARQNTTRPARLSIGRGWRFLLSQPMVAAATVVFVLGFGIYAHYWMRDYEKTQDVQSPALEEEIATPMKMEAPTPQRKRTQPTPLRQLYSDDMKAKTVREAPAKPAPQGVPPIPPKTDTTAPVGGEEPGFMKGRSGGAADLAPEPVPAAKPLAPTSGKMLQEKKKMKKAPAAPAAKVAPGAAPRRSLSHFATEGESSLSQANLAKFQKLVDQGRSKMSQKKYHDALKDLLEAQRIQDTEELRKLIAQCRANIRLIEQP